MIKVVKRLINWIEMFLSTSTFNYITQLNTTSRFSPRHAAHPHAHYPSVQ